MPTDILTSIPIVKVGGQELPDAVSSRFTELRIDMAAGSIGTARLRFREADEHDADPFKVGAKVSIGVLDEDGVGAEVFNGVVTALGIARDDDGTDLIVDVFDESIRLGQRSITRSHLNVAPADVIGAIARHAGLAYSGPSSLDSPTLDFVQQTGTPHQFLDAFVQHLGLEWGVVGMTLSVWARDSESPIDIGELRRFHARYSGIEESNGVTVRGWDPARKSAHVGEVKRNQGALSQNTIPIVEENRFKLSQQQGVSYGRPSATVKQATDAAAATQRRMEAAVLTGRGEVDVNPKIVPGCVVKVSGVASQWDGEYRVTAVEHVFGHPGQSFVTRFTVGELGPTTLVDLFGGARENSTQMVANTISIGLVDSVKDPQSLGRVRVKFPFMTEQTTSTWARVVHHGAGRQRGWLMMPEVDDEVVVAFEHGDLERPVVIGGLYSRADPPKITGLGGNGKIDSRSFTSRKGHQLVFSDLDSPGEAFVSVTLADGVTKLILAQDRVELVANTKPITIKSGQAQIVLGDDGSITLKGTKVVVQASQNVDVDAKTGVKLKSAATMAVEGLTVDVKASAKASINGGGMTEVKGAMVKVN